MCPGCSAVDFRFVGVVYAALVLLALRALPCVVLRCLAFVLCVLVGGMSYIVPVLVPVVPVQSLAERAYCNT